MTSEGTVDLSVIVPVYYNEGSLGCTYDALVKQVFAQHSGMKWEVIFVDDGSEDGSWREICDLHQAHRDGLTAIKFRRNFGQVSALLAGMQQARGRCVVMLSADGQDPPAIINDMLRYHKEEKYEIVIAARAGRDETWERRVTSRGFYYLMRALCFQNMPAGGLTLFFRQAHVGSAVEEQ